MLTRPKAARRSAPAFHNLENPNLDLLGQMARTAGEEDAVARLEWRIFFEPKLLAPAREAIERAAFRARRPLLIAVLVVLAFACGSVPANPRASDLPSSTRSVEHAAAEGARTSATDQQRTRESDRIFPHCPSEECDVSSRA